MPVRNGIFPHISKQEGQSHQQLQLSWMVSLWALKGTQGGKNTCHLAAIRVQALPMLSPEEPRMWKNSIFAPDSPGTYQRSNSVSLDFVLQSMGLQRVRHDWVTKNNNKNLWTKVHIVKVMVFPVAMYECYSWTIKKAESQRIDAFKLWC